MNQFDKLNLQESYINAHTVPTLSNDLDTHTVHSGETMLSREECSQRFTHSSNLAAHMRIVHSTGQATLHQCSHCPYSTIDSASSLR